MIPVAWQRDLISAMLESSDTLCVAPTGKGKSLPMFQVAQTDNPVVVVVPLVALADNLDLRATQQGLQSYAWHGKLAGFEKTAVSGRIERGDYQIVFTTPESLHAINLAKVSHVVVDEAHSIFSLATLRPEYLHMWRKLSSKEFRKCHRYALHALSATLSLPERDRLALDMACSISCPPYVDVADIARHDIEVSIQRIESKDMPDFVKSIPGRQLIFCQTTRRAEDLARALACPDVYHGKLTGDRRVNTIARWHAGSCNRIVATNALGVGVDLSGVDAVLHDGPAKSLAEQVQEIGRTGRWDQGGKSIVMMSGRDWIYPDRLFLDCHPSPEVLHKVWRYAKLDDIYHDQATLCYATGENPDTVRMILTILEQLQCLSWESESSGYMIRRCQGIQWPDVMDRWRQRTVADTLSVRAHSRAVRAKSSDEFWHVVNSWYRYARVV